jgi:hypothetical protein
MTVKFDTADDERTSRCVTRYQTINVKSGIRLRIAVDLNTYVGRTVQRRNK